MSKNLLLTSVLVSSLFLVACGDGSGSHRRDSVVPPDENVSANTGFLIDSVVSGVAYVTPTHQGVTGPEGEFQYEEGETVRFMLGDTLLGEVAAQPQVTPFELAGSAVITGTPNIDSALEDESDPFHTVINIAILLQSLDRDGDPENGIEITPDVAALFKGVSLDLSQHWETFREEYALRHVFGQANTQHLFDEAQGIANPAPSLHHLYQTLEIDPRIFGRIIKQWDTEGDGAPDVVASSTYDAQGNLTRLEGDIDADGTPNFVSRFAYDVDGNLAQQAIDRDGDGTLEKFDNWQYDASGNLTRREREMDGDGMLDVIWSYEYDADGNRTRWEDDFDADGTPETVTSYTYDAQGNLTRSDWEGHNYADGTPGEAGSSEYVYDAQGHLTRKETDYDADGTPDQIESYEYDDQGRLTRRETDYDADGTPEIVSITEYQSEADGSSTVTTMRSSDDGEPQLVHSQQYDASGNLIREESLKGFLDSINYEIRNYEYDANGDLVRETVTRDFENNDTLDQIQKYEYEFDAHGNLTRETYDYGGDGIMDRVVSYQYDANNYLSRKERITDKDGDGLSDQIKICQYLYDLDGNLTQEEGECEGGITLNIDASPLFIQHRLVTYEYEATGWGVIF